MKSSLTMLKRAVPLACASMLVAGAAQAALQDRDLNGDTVVDAFYDTDLDITWLRDANVNGKMNWDAAMAWAASFSFGGYSDWRLPTTDTACHGLGCPGSEMGHLWMVELGNAGGGNNKGGFQNLLASDYWSATEYAPDLRIAWYHYNWANTPGGQGYNYKYNELNAMAVRDGDVPSIPEPETYALMLAGLAGLVVARRRLR